MSDKADIHLARLFTGMLYLLLAFLVGVVIVLVPWIVVVPPLAYAVGWLVDRVR